MPTKNLINNAMVDDAFGLASQSALCEVGLGGPKSFHESVSQVWVLSSSLPQAPNVQGIWQDAGIWNASSIWYG